MMGRSRIPAEKIDFTKDRIDQMINFRPLSWKVHYLLKAPLYHEMPTFASMILWHITVGTIPKGILLHLTGCSSSRFHWSLSLSLFDCTSLHRKYLLLIKLGDHMQYIILLMMMITHTLFSRMEKMIYISMNRIKITKFSRGGSVKFRQQAFATGRLQR